MKFTKASVAKIAAPDPSGRQRLLWDDDLKGFGMLVSGKTSTKTWIVQKALPGGNRRRITVGAVNILDVDEARRRAILELAKFADGKDPKEERRREARQGTTLRQALEQYLKGKKTLRASSAALYRREVEGRLTAWLDRPLRTITAEMVEQRHIQIAEEISRRSRVRQETGQAAANGAMRALRMIWNDAADRILELPPNPTRRLRGGRLFPVSPRERTIPKDKMGRWYRAVDGLPSRTARDYLLLLLFTGMRRNEATGLRWEEVDFAQRAIRIPGVRTKRGKVLHIPMNSFVRDILIARRALGNDGGWVFGGNGKEGHFNDPRTSMKMVMEETGVLFSCHDLRRTFVTVGAASIDFLVLKALVGHTVKDQTADYARLDVEDLREGAQRVCDKLVELCEIGADGDEVARLA